MPWQHSKDDPSSRKRFLRMVGGAGAAGALGVLLAACGGDKKDTTTSSQADTQSLAVERRPAATSRSSTTR